MEHADTDIEGLWSRHGPAVVRRCRQLLRDISRTLSQSESAYFLLRLPL